MNTGAIMFCLVYSVVSLPLYREFVSDSEGHMYTVLCFII